MLCQLWFYVFCTVCTVCWSIWNQSSPRCWNNNVLCGSVRVCARKQARTHPHVWPEDKVKENAQYQSQTSTAIRKGHPGVCLCAPLSLHRVHLPSLFGGTSVHSLSPLCVCICVILGKFVFPKPLRQSASHFLEDDFPGFLPPVIPSLCPASCREPRLPLSSFLLYSWNCRIRLRIAKYIGLKWGEIDEKEGKIRLPRPRVIHFRMQSVFIASDNQSFVLS